MNAHVNFNIDFQFRGNPITDEQREEAEKLRAEKRGEIDQLRERAKHRVHHYRFHQNTCDLSDLKNIEEIRESLQKVTDEFNCGERGLL
jgi:chloramphenicol 3-O-phosphotransferase